MPKNWLCYPIGNWIWSSNPGDPSSVSFTQSSGTARRTDGVYTWIDKGITYIDPESINMVTELDEPTKSTVLHTASGEMQTRKRSAQEVIADIQSALAN